MIYAHSSLFFDQRGSPARAERQVIVAYPLLFGTTWDQIGVCFESCITENNFENEASVCGRYLQRSRLQQLYCAWMAFASKFIACQVMWALLKIAADNFLLVSVKGIVLGLISQMSSSEWKCHLYVSLVSCGNWVATTKLITIFSMDQFACASLKMHKN